VRALGNEKVEPVGIHVTLRISELFYSIQGEGAYQGVPTTFIRFQGCNLLPNFCKWCDTKYAQGSGGKEIPIEEVLEEAVGVLLPYEQWVCITGGEPLFQPDGLEQLVRELKRRGALVEIETNGSLPKPKWWTLVDSWCADFKCPSSGVVGVSRKEWFETRPQDQVKFVCETEEDLEFAADMIRKHVGDRGPIVLVSPVIKQSVVRYDSLASKKVSEIWEVEWLQRCVEFAKEHRARFSLQLHKVIWGNRKGV